MGIKERRNIEKTELKRKIMDAAIQIIEQEGYEKLSIRKIAARIEYSPTTIYLYYKDKAEIIRDMSDGLYRKVIDDVTAFIIENAMLPEDRQVREMMRLFLKGLCSEPEMVKAVMFSGVNAIFAASSTDSHTACSSDPPVLSYSADRSTPAAPGNPTDPSNPATVNNSGIAMLDQLISDGIDKKIFRPAIGNTAWMLVSAMLGFVMNSAANQLHLLDHFDQLVDDFLDVLINGMKM